ncbi:MAG: HAMP domain-containing protein [Thermoanaerobacteraceae bacterium]|nr:HAMP domain-containing protein [Thermoanaerobacteraceae bacterium]
MKDRFPIRLFRKFFNLVGVKAKIMGIAVLLVLLLGTLLIWQAENTFSRVLRQDLTKQGVSLGNYLAARSENLLLTNNIYALHELIRDTMANNSEVAYIFITDSEGQVVIDSFDRGIPKGLKTFNKVAEGEKYSQRTFATREGLIQDIAVPILDGKAGQIRLGLSEKGIVLTIEKLLTRLWTSTVIISLVGVLIAFLLSTLITNPLHELVIAAKNIGEGRLDYRVSLDWARDELGHLAKAFNEMAGKLQKAEQEREELWQEVMHKEKMRRFLLNKVITAQEEERLRISRELHDETGQALSSVNLALASLEGSQTQEELHQRVTLMQQTVRKALEGIHLLARQLRPSVLDKLGLAAAVERFIKDCSAYWGKDIGLTTVGCSGDHIPPEIKIAAYRIVQEALTNALRHAEAENISVVLQKTKDKVLAIIEDDGKGFDLDNVLRQNEDMSHLGLFGMQERANMLGGSLNIETAPGKGTTVYAELPLNGREASETEKVSSAAGG